VPEADIEQILKRDERSRFKPHQLSLVRRMQSTSRIARMPYMIKDRWWFRGVFRETFGSSVHAFCDSLSR
jgi:hypothetical protein